MPRRFIKKYIPKRDKIVSAPGMSVFGKLLHDPNLWHLNRRSVSVGMGIGMFFAFMPIPGQTIIAPAVAILMRANLPIAFIMTFITNPVTMAPVFYLTYKFGQHLLHSPPVQFNFQFSWDWFNNEFLQIWQPLLFGSLLVAISAGSIGYTVMNGVWRYAVKKRWKQRRKRRERIDS